MPTSALGLRYPGPSDAPNVAQDFSNLVTDFESLLNSGFTAYTPALTAVTTSPVLGNGSLNGFYKKTGTTLLGYISFLAGSTTTYGSGEWLWGVPAGLGIADRNVTIGMACLRDVSAAVHYLAACNRNTINNFHLRLHGSNLLGQGTPVTLAAGDLIRIWYETEAA
jgi:hypothetical protein